MYPDIFIRCIEIVLNNEGNDKVVIDSGGLTKYGISQKAYPDLDIRNLTRDKAIAIYFSDYFAPMNLTMIRIDDIILQLFDFGCNVGPKTSIKTMQKLIGVEVDGICGMQTITAINDYNGNLVADFKKQRKLFYVTLVQKKEELRPYLKGWLSRVEKTHF